MQCRSWWILFLVVVSLAACAPPEDGPGGADASVELIERPAIYGNDDRLEVYEHPDAQLRALGERSTVALIYPGSLNTSNPNDVTPIGATLAQAHDLCAGERFASQVTSAHCSGTLIDDDLVLTAGHCVDSTADCQSKYFVFNYHYESGGQLATITSQDVFTCDQIVVRSDTPDYAIIQLDRSATPRFSPASVRTAAQSMGFGDGLGMIGFPSGIPAKIDSGGQVIDPNTASSATFVATTDSFGGNSGSGVYNSSDEVVGILVAGAQDYSPTGGGCWVATQYPSSGSGGGESVTYVHHAITDLCDSGWPSARLCSTTPPPTDAWCDDCTGGCPVGWFCGGWQDTNIGWCTTGCASDSDCSSEYYCEPTYGCVPNTFAACFNDDVWIFDDCGNRIVETEDCTAAGEVCQSGACTTSGGGCSDECALGATRCSSSNRTETCVTGSQGCTVWGSEQNCAANEACDAGACVPVDAWCQSCDPGTAPCPAGWNCWTWGVAPNITFCAPTCSSDADCRSDHFCDPDGDCVPDRFDACYNNDVWFSDACGNPLTLTQSCGSGQTCSSGACVAGCSNECVEGATRCDGSGIQTCAVGGDGCTDWSSTQSCSNGGVCINDGDCVVSQDAWCESCASVSDCPTGWGCFVWSGVNSTWCGKPCNADTECRSDHTCNGGYCIPDIAPGCYNEDVWSVDSCGNPVEVLTDCPVTCQSASCVSGCTNQCTTGESRCTVSGAVEACAVGAGGCTEWGTAQACGQNEVCVQGACAAACADDCVDGQTRCTTDGAVEFCAVDGDGCTSWGGAVPCAEGRVCDAGACVIECAIDCIPGIRRCADDTQIDVCATGDDGCRVWEPLGSCDPGKLCVGDGACVDDPNPPAEDTSPGGDTASGEDTTTASDVDPAPEDVGGGQDTGGESDVSGSADTSALTPPPTSATDDCACVIRRDRSTSRSGAPLPWSLGLLGACAWVGLRRRARQGGDDRPAG